MPRLSQLVLLATLGVGSAVQATTLEQLSMDDLILKSTGIVRARVVSSSSGLRGTDMFTYHRLEVSEVWKGPRPVEVAVPGGMVRGIRQAIAGVPYLTPGDEYILFLWTSKSGLTQVIGMTQGVFGVKVDASGNPVVFRAASVDPMVDRGGRAVKDVPVTLGLSEMRTRVKNTLVPREVE